MGPKPKPKSANATTHQSSTKSVPPNWPVLAPLVPSVTLSLDSILDGQILVIRNLFTSTLCKTYIPFLATLPLTTTPGKPKRGEATRVNDRYQVEDPVFADLLWRQTGLQGLVSSWEKRDIWEGDLLGLNPNIRIYRYRPGQFFDQHYDESNKLDFGNEKIRAKTSWTLLVYLTACEGGQTVFYPESEGKKGQQPSPIVVATEPGMALLHKHGDDCLLHEGREVIRGEKWVLRSDLVVKR